MEAEKDDQRIRITKLMVRKALTELLMKKPIESITVKELCKMAQINRGTFYNHYHDIYDLLEQMEQEMINNLNQVLDNLAIHENLENSSVAICSEIFEMLRQNSDMCTVLLGEHSDKKFLADMILLGKEKCIEEYLRHYTKANIKQIEYFYSFISDGCIGLLKQWLKNDMAESAVTIAHIAESIILSGIQFLEKPMP